MKPRLKSAPLSFADVQIWYSLGTRWKQASPVWMPQAYLDSDRRDADLMLELTSCRDVIGPSGTAIAHMGLRGHLASDSMYIDGFVVFLG